MPRSRACSARPRHSFLGELHPLPVVVARLVLPAELHAERLGRRALGGGDVRLELHGVGAGVRDRVDERVRQAEAAVVRQRDLADDQATTRTKNRLGAQVTGLMAQGLGLMGV